MNEEKKKIIISELNRRAYEFAQEKGFDPSWHKKIRKNDLWGFAKTFLIVFKIQEEKELICEACRKPIWRKKKAESVLERYKCALHHIIYDEKAYFSPENCSILHNHCHQKIHGK